MGRHALIPCSSLEHARGARCPDGGPWEFPKLRPRGRCPPITHAAVGEGCGQVSLRVGLAGPKSPGACCRLCQSLEGPWAGSGLLGLSSASTLGFLALTYRAALPLTHTTPHPATPISAEFSHLLQPQAPADSHPWTDVQVPRWTRPGFRPQKQWCPLCMMRWTGRRQVPGQSCSPGP